MSERKWTWVILASVFMNELTRILLRQRTGFAPPLSDEQARRFANYGGEADRRDTVLARILSGDPSAGTPTFMQRNEAVKLRGLLGE